MLGPNNESAAIEALAAYPGGLMVGGGINPKNATRYLDSGASHVIVTSYVFNGGRIDWQRLEEMVAAVGKKRLVLDLSCKKKGDKYFIVTDRWQKFSSEIIDAQLLSKLSNSCDEFLVHAADIEGLKSGIDSELIKLLAQISPLPLTYAGGIRSVEDLQEISKIGNSRIDATVGSALDIFGGSLKYSDVVHWNNEQKREL